ncbi:hypothetical protein FOCC_FOCC012849 [Frankliniella occidentalis]|nr:hypothetical protein FOCC_FOCC012849 [Frankliniella occidentalis]
MGEARSRSKAPSPKREPSSSAAIGEHPKKAAKAEKQVDSIPLRDKPELKWREMSIVTEEVERACKNATSLGDVKTQISDSTKLEPKKPFEDFRANLMETRLRSRVAHEQPTPQDTIVLDDESDDCPASNNDDGQFLPLKTTRKKRVSSLSLNENQGIKKGRGKGNKNKQASKETLREELKQSKAQIEALRAAELKVDNDLQRLKPAVSSLFSSGTKTNTHPFIGVKKAIIDNKEDLKFEMIGSAIEDRFIEQIYDGCLLPSTDTCQWSDVGGLEEVKKSMKEVVIDPLRRPDIFTGLRAAPKGVLLYGPPGTGKTLIARCIASPCQSNFFNVSASKLTSKWVGDGEKTVQALFAVARAMQPSVFFIDEVDSVLSKRTEKENESSKKMKTEFLVQMVSAATKTENDQILVIGATNRPADLDEAVRRRFQNKILIPLPDAQEEDLTDISGL